MCRMAERSHLAQLSQTHLQKHHWSHNEVPIIAKGLNTNFGHRALECAFNMATKYLGNHFTPQRIIHFILNLGLAI